MYTASILSLLALAATTIAAPAGQVAGYERAVVTQTILDNVEVTVTVTPGQQIPTAASTPINAISEAADGSLEIAAPASASTQQTSVASVASASSVTTPVGGVFAATSVESQKVSTTAKSTAKASSIPSTTLQTKTSAAASSAAKTTAPATTGAVSAKNGLLTIQITNSMDNAVTTSYQGATPPVSGASGTGVMTKGATAAFAVASGWHGGVAVSNVKNSGNDGLIEGSFVDQGFGTPVVDIDISYVNGYTVPMTCSCVATNEVLSGCNLDLFSMSTCTTSGAVQGQVCPNPLRESLANDLTPNAFFADCQGAAYTYPNDNDANAGNGKCQSGVVSCCIGSSCPKNPQQKK